MVGRVLLLNFEIEESNIDTRGILFSQHYYLKDKTLTIIFPQRANSKRGMSLDFELSTDTYGLFALLTFCFGIKINDSFTGYLFNNNSSINRLLHREEKLENLRTSLLASPRVSNLDGSGNTPGFSDISSWPRKNFNNIALTQQLMGDLLNHLHSLSDPTEFYTLLDYWRRGYDLELLHYGMEAFLNFFKIIESIIGKRPVIRGSMDDGWITNRLTTLRMKSYSKIFIYYRNLRNRYNIGHPVRRVFLRRDYGHYLNSFDDDIWNHISDIAEVSKCLLLRSIGLKKYKLIEDGGLLFLST